MLERVKPFLATALWLSVSCESMAAGNQTELGSKIEEVVVTAQKREERLQDVPVPVTAISAETLISSGQLRIRDYYTSVPGLSVTPITGTTQLINLRGVVTFGGTPTVGVLIDDVPFGSSTFLGGGRTVPDIDPGDLARVEVLRGPQGTLYGTSSLGGLMKFVTVDPSTEEMSGRLQAGASYIHNGDDPGYNARASFNVPLSQTWALRASGFTREEPGYIDNPLLGSEAVNSVRVSGGRLATLWRPSQNVSLKLNALYQDTVGEATDLTATQAAFGVAPAQPLGDLQQGYIAGTGEYEDKTQVYSAILSAKLGRAELISLTGYNVHENTSMQDATPFYGSVARTVFGVAGAPFESITTTRKFSQETRLTVPLGQRFEWLAGAFYTKEDTTPFTQNVFASDPVTGQVVAHFSTTDFPSELREYAGFTDLTYRVTDRFDIQVGARASHTKQAAQVTNVFLGTTTILPKVEVSADAFTYLVTPRFKVSPDLMVYGRLASGYRAGGPNLSPAVPPQFDPDKTQNYEVGLKGSFLDDTLSVDTSVYYIDWKDTQIQLFDLQTGRNYLGNTGRSKSQGVELAIQWKPLRGLTIGSWVAWNEAELKERIPPAALVLGAPGDRLPYSPGISGNFSIDQEFALGSSMMGFVGGTVSYVGDVQVAFKTTAQRPILPPYARTDLRAGVKYDSWTISLFANNITDRRGIVTGGGDIGGSPTISIPIQPRLIGLSALKTF